VKTWHAAIASLGTAAFLVAAYIAVLSVSGALFAFTDLSTAGTAEQAPPLKTVVAVKPVKVKPVVARVPEPEPEPEPAPEPVPAESSLVEPAPTTLASSDGGGDDGVSGNALSNSQNPPIDDTDRSDAPDEGGSGREEDRDEAALVSDDGVNLSGSAKNLTDKVNEGLKNGTGVDLSKVTDPVVKTVDHLERSLGLDRQGR
jgi:hypothetical protein